MPGRSMLRVMLTFVLVAAGLTSTTIGTSAPAYADECYTWSRTLTSGTAGSDVTELQVRVAGWAGYGVVMSIDGSFGAQTKTAVTSFQKAYGLAADGVAGPNTYAMIYALQDPDCSPAHFTWAEVSYNCGRGLNSNGSGFGGILGPGYPGHDDHTHVDIRSTRSWSASECGI